MAAKTAMIIEKDEGLTKDLLSLLEENAFLVKIYHSIDDALGALAKQPEQIVFLGHPRDASSPFEALDRMVRAHPFASIILVTELAPDEVEEKAEGYGIMGSLGWKASPEELASLLDQYEKIRNMMNEPDPSAATKSHEP